MADPTNYDELLAGAYGIGDREQALALQMAQAQKLREQARAPRQFTSPGAALGGAISQGLVNYQGAQMAAQAGQGMAALGAQRSALVKSLPARFDGPTVSDVFTASDPDMVTSRAASVTEGAQKRHALARSLIAAGDPALTKLAASYESDATGIEKQLDPGVLKLTLQDRKHAVEQEKLAGQLERAGMHEKAATIRANIMANAPRFGFSATPGTPDAGYSVNQRTGEAVPVGVGSRLGPDGRPLGGGAGKAVDPQYEKFIYKTAPAFQTSRNVMGTDVNTANRIARAQILIASKKDTGYTKQEVEDITLALAGVLTGGSVAARTTIDNLSYKTLRMSASDALQYLVNSPQDSGAQEFVQRISGILQNEYAGAKDRVKNEVIQPAIGLRQVLAQPHVRPDAEDYLRSFGMMDADLAQIFPAQSVTPPSPVRAGAPPPPPRAPAGETKEQLKARLRKELLGK